MADSNRPGAVWYHRSIVQAILLGGAVFLLLTVAGMAVGSGLLLDALFKEMPNWDPKPVGMEMIPMWLQIASAVVLLADLR